MIERIEVVKGPRSALYGTDAIGGVINVITRRGARDGWSAEVGYGDYDTRQASLNGGLATERIEFDLGVSWLDSDGLPDAHHRRHRPRLRQPERVGATARPTSVRPEVALRHWSAQGTSEYSDFFLTPVDQDFENSTSCAVGRVAGRRRRRGPSSAPRGSRTASAEPVGGLPAHRRATALDAQVDWRGRPGACPRRRRDVLATSRRAASPTATRMRADTDTVNLFVQDRIEAGRTSRPARARLHRPRDRRRRGHLERSSTATPLGGATLLYGLAGTGFRAPDATDRYGFGGNPALEPERSRNLEVGVRHRLDERHAAVARRRSATTSTT